MSDTHKKAVLRQLSFGNQVAEEERETLKDYFVKTQAWERINKGDIDIIYGPKGAGKSALYFLIQENAAEFHKRRVLLVAAENPQGAPAFKDLEVDPPTTEREFTAIWKLYFLSLVGRAMEENAIDNANSKALIKALTDHGLMPSKKPAWAASCRRFVLTSHAFSIQPALKRA
jgi:hypothetical protein